MLAPGSKYAIRAWSKTRLRTEKVMTRKLETLTLLIAFCAASLTHAGCKSKKDKMRKCKRKCEKKLKLKAAQRFCKPPTSWQSNTNKIEKY